jgi:hypothetical protein
VSADDLFKAAVRGDAAAMQALLDKGADVNAKGNHGATALMLASDAKVRALLVHASIPWDYIGKVPAHNEAFFNMHKAVLPEIFTKVRSMGSDPVLMLVAFEQEKWRALLALLYKRPQNMFLTPETYLGTKPNISNNGYCDVYVAPIVNGNPMQSAVFALERDWLESELYWVIGLPPMFIQWVRDKPSQPDAFTVVVFAAAGMRVEELPRSTTAGSVAPDAGAGAGTSVNAKSKPEGTALLEAARKGDSNKVKALIAAGADVNARDKEGTALMYVAAKCDTDSVKAMIAAGADVNAKNNSWGSPLQMSARDGNLDSLKALIAAGANVNEKDDSACTALMSVAGNHGFEFYSRIDAFNAALEALITAGADANVNNKWGATAIMWAARNKKRLAPSQVARCGWCGRKRAGQRRQERAYVC